MFRSERSTGRAVFLMAVAAVSAGIAHGGVVATNADVPANMNATGGTASDPKAYVFDSYVKDFGATSLSIGPAAGASWVRLEIRNGATVTTTGTGNRVGSDANGYTNEFCSCVVTGGGSALTMGLGRIGGKSPNNSLVVADGASVSLTGDLTCGYDDRPFTNNVILVDGGTLNVGAARLRLGYGNGNDFNVLTVRNGGVVSTTTGRLGIRYGKYCDIRVEGEDSRIEIGFSAANALMIGEGTTSPHHNTLTLVDGGVCKLTNPAGTVSVNAVAAEGGSGVRFAAGILAVAGNRTAHIPYDKAWLWDGDVWAPAPVDWTGTYYADETAAAAAGFAGFGGYTVFTGGEPLAEETPTATVVIIH